MKFEEWVHIGDNYNSDYIIPKSLGMEAFNYKNVNTYEKVEYNSIFESIILGVRNNFLYNGNELSYWEKFGIKYLTPLYTGFTNWIYQMTYKYDNIFFLARDGYIIEKIFKLFPNNKYTKYLYCSRKSVQIPTMLSGESKDIIYYVLNNIESQITLKELFKNCKLETKAEYEKILKLYGFNSFEEKITQNKKYDALKCILAVFDDAKPRIKEEREIVKKYLIQEGLDKFDTVNIVDVGWGGSIQRSIQKVLDKNVRGYYFGTINIENDDFNFSSFGYMFDQDNDIYDKAVIFSKVMMYELIFSAPHGSVERYEEKNGKIEPVLKNNDNYLEIVDIFQKASIKVIQEIMKYYDYYDSIDKHFSVKFYQEFLDKYNYEDLVQFSYIENDWLLGNDKKFPYVQKIDKQILLNNLDKFEEITDKSLWKGAFLIKDCETEEEHNLFISELIRRRNPEQYPSELRKIIRRVVPLKLRKAIKNNYKK